MTNRFHSVYSKNDMIKDPLKKTLHLTDWSSTEYNVFNSHLVTLGDDVYHDHEFYEIVYLLNGTLKQICNGQPLDLTAGDIFFLRPNDTHCFLRDETNTKIAHRDLFFRLDFFENVCNFLDKDFLNEYKNSPMPVKIHLPIEKLVVFEKKTEKYYQLPSEQKTLYAKFFLIELLSLYNTEKNASENQNVEKYPGWLNQLLQKMNMVEYYKDGLPVILSFFDLERSYMCHAFKKYLHMTMTDYLNNLRLEYAANQLLLTSNSVLDIAIEAGFSSLSYFSGLFKKRFGYSPSIYRKNKKIT